MIIIQARSTSERYPGKILERFAGTFLLDHIYQTCQTVGNTIVAVPTDDACIPYLRTSNIPYFEGSENDVLLRYYKCAKEHKMDWIIRVTGDCPLINPANLLYTQFLASRHKVDFITNCLTNCIDGQEIEFVSFNALEWLCGNVESAYHREHVTTWIKEHMDEFQINFKTLSWRDHMPPELMPKMSVDTPDDLDRCRIIYNETVNVCQSQS